MDRMLKELRQAARSLGRSPGFTVVAVLTLSLGIGATAAVFAVLNAVALRPLPYPEAERLVWLSSPVPGVEADARWGLSPAGYFHFREHATTLEEIGGFAGALGNPPAFNVVTEQGAERVAGAVVTASTFRVLGARPQLGRLILDDDDRPGAAPVAVLGHEFWLRNFGGDPGIIGRTMQVQGQVVEVVGVTQPGFHLPHQRVEVWLPLGLDPAAPPVNTHWVAAVGRARPGVDAAAVERELARLSAGFTELFPGAYPASFMESSGFTTAAEPLRERVIGGLDRVLWTILGAVALVLLIAAANVANLFLVRADDRRRERAVRSALGARRRDLVRRSLAESLLVGAAGALAGVILARIALRLLLATAPQALPPTLEIGLGWETALLALALGCVAAVVFGVVTAVQGADPGALKEGGRGQSQSRRQHAVRRTLVAGQVALALVLLAAAGVMFRSFHALRSVDPGFQVQHALTFRITLPGDRYPTSQATAAFHREFSERLAGLPGVVAVGGSNVLPLEGTWGCSAVFLEDQPVAFEHAPCVPTPRYAPGYFDALGTPVRGVVPGWQEHENGAAGAIVTRALAERFWPGEDALGKGIRGNGNQPPFYRIVGIAGDIRADGLDRAPVEAVFFPAVPIPGAGLWGNFGAKAYVVRTAGTRAEDLVPAVRRILAELDGEVPASAFATLEDVVARSGSVARAALAMLLLGVAAAMALLLAAVGLGGAIAYIVAQRRQEFGIRMALGAEGRTVAGMVLRQALAVTGAGLLLGLLGALAVNRVLAALLFEVRPNDPLTLGAVALLLVAVAMAAAWVPARQATRVDPADGLRES
jgi:putative ABC transport system permease protein